MAVLIVAGLHVPVMLLVDVGGSAGAVAFSQRGPIALNVGATWLLTTISMVVVVAPWPPFGVKV